MASKPWVHLHAHSEFSALDGVSHIDDMVRRVGKMGHPALALTDHGVMSGSVGLYKACRKAGIEPIVGMEIYLVEHAERPSGRQTEDRYHLTVLARNYDGYKALVKLATRSHRRDRYHRKPRLTLQDFADIGPENLTVLTGCYFGPLQQALVKHGPDRAERVLRGLAHVLPNLYVEVQHHHTDHGEYTDDELVAALGAIAQSVGVRPVVTQDSHYCSMSHKTAHDMMKHLVIHNAGNGDAGFPGDSYHLCTAKWAREHYITTDAGRALWSDNLDSIAEVLHDTEIRIPVLEKYQWHVPSVNTEPLTVITKRCRKVLRGMALDPDARAEYEDRLRYELSIIEDTGFAGYFDLVTEYVDWAKSQNILVNARGSANGSLVAWLLGITNVDPIRWGLMVERFIDRSRKRPPDIDLDIEQTMRGEVIDYISSRFNVAQIGTFLTMSMTEAEGGRGSLLVNYIGYKRRTMMPKAFQRTFGPDAAGSLISRIAQHDRSELEALRLLDTLKVRRAAGAHPAGFILDGPNHHISDLVPTMLIPSSDTQVTQYQMDEVEDLGFIKIDLLGLRSLTVLRRCQELIGRDDPTDLSWIPVDDAAACKVLSDAVYESGIFQMEGWAIAKGVRAMKIRRTSDCIVAVSLFRPALLEPGYDEEYIRNRNPRNRKSNYPHAIFRKHLAPTYGVPLYQEQVLEVLRDLGVSPDSLNDVLKAVKGKQGGKDSEALFQATHQHYTDLALAAGMTPKQAADGWELIEGFVGYGFNKAHATAYGLMAYQAGYLKAHYPLEYMAAALESVSGTDKESAYLKEARRMGLKIRRADVNTSGVSWSLDRKIKGIRRGLTSIKGIGHAAANAISDYAPYTDIDDFVARSGKQVTGKADYRRDRSWKGTLAILREAGALQSLGITA